MSQALGVWFHQVGDIGHSWLCFLSQERLISTQEHNTTERILENEGEAEAPTAHRHQDRLHSKVRDTHIDHTPPPGSIAPPERSSLSLHSYSGRENPVGITSIPQHWGRFRGVPTLINQRDCGTLAMMEKGEGFATSACILADQVHTYVAQGLIPNHGFARQQNQPGGHTDQGI